jgi:hypothetical protein
VNIVHDIASETRQRAMKDAMDARGKAKTFAMKRKEEYLGARVPKELKSQIMQKAKELDIPVSLLLRKVLEEVFMQDTPGDSVLALVAQHSIKSLEDSKLQRYASVLGWKAIELNQPKTCDRCHNQMHKGESAMVGIVESGVDVFVCETCKKQIQETE